MDFLFRRAANPWGQEILVGIAWDLIWAALFIGVAFVIAHAIYVGAVARKVASGPGSGPPGIPERVVRHTASARAFHWLMAAAMLTLLVTAFFPLVGLQFAWVTIHWIAGVVLAALIVWHIYAAIFQQDMKAIWIGGKQIAEMRAAVARFFRRDRDPEPRTAKYPNDQRMFHHAATITGIGAIVTGLLMMLRIDTFLWESNPYFLSDGTWGLVFVLHGLCGVGLITLVVAHIYFAIRPEKRWMTLSMIRGWITREEYLEHYDPEQWPIEGAVEAGRGSSEGADPEAVAPA